MPIQLSGRLIFLASPGDLAEERLVVERAVRRFNEQRGFNDGVAHILRGWEQVPAGVGRPQELINQELRRCDYMVLLLGDRWGTPPSVDGAFSSGTEEEFHQCLGLLASPEASMRDLLVLFKTLDPNRLRDPGPQLAKVLEFRNQLETTKQILFAEFDSDQSLSDVLERSLTLWAKPLGERETRSITLQTPPMPVSTLGTTSTSDLLASAKAFAANGQFVQAEAAFANAIRDVNPEALYEFARFMRRRGLNDRALELNKQLIAIPTLLSADDAASMSLRVRALANVGVILRKRGALAESIEYLREAVNTARSSSHPVTDDLCYALDNYGYTLLRANETERALTQFDESHSIRREFGTDQQLAQSAINIGRVRLALAEPSEAQQFFDEAMRLLEAKPDDDLMANALTGIAEVALHTAPTDDVLPTLVLALEANERVGYSDGIAITHGLIARLDLAAGRLASALNHIEAIERECDKSNNPVGRGTALVLRSAYARLRGDGAKAFDLALQASHFAESSNDPLLRSDAQAALQEAVDSTNPQS